MVLPDNSALPHRYEVYDIVEAFDRAVLVRSVTRRQQRQRMREGDVPFREENDIEGSQVHHVRVCLTLKPAGHRDLVERLPAAQAAAKIGHFSAFEH